MALKAMEWYAYSVLPHDELRLAGTVVRVVETRNNDDGTISIDGIDVWTLIHVTLTVPKDTLLQLRRNL